jgi:hypothetical protein
MPQQIICSQSDWYFLGRLRSPRQVVGNDEILVGIVLGRSLFILLAHDERVLIALTNALSGFRWHHFMMAPVANNRELTLTDFPSPLSIDCDSADFSAVHKTVIVVAFQARQARLFDQLLNLSSKGFSLSLLLLPTIEFQIASRFLCLRVLRAMRRHIRRPFASRLWLPSAQLFCLAGFLHLALGDESSLQQLIA